MFYSIALPDVDAIIVVVNIGEPAGGAVSESCQS
jgi:hypothetical protein